MKLLECVPNFSEGRDIAIINKIAAAIESVNSIKILYIDSGEAANRTVITFVGEPDAVIEAAFQAIKTAGELIDMTQHKGVHPRIGATDVCPLIPLSDIAMEETVVLSKKLAQRVGEELGIPVYLYENSGSAAHRKNLADIRRGEYEGLEEKMKHPDWKPDYGRFLIFDFGFSIEQDNKSKIQNPKSKIQNTGATVIGARDFLVAYNVNLDTQDVSIAKKIAAEIREKVETLQCNVSTHLKSVKAIGWYIEEYQRAQVSMNLTNIQVTSVHTAFEACKKIAEKYGVSVTGSELIGLIPEKVLLDAGKFYEPHHSTLTLSSLIAIAVKHLGLDELKPFNPNERVIEFFLFKE